MTEKYPQVWKLNLLFSMICASFHIIIAKFILIYRPRYY